MMCVNKDETDTSLFLMVRRDGQLSEGETGSDSLFFFSSVCY